MAGTNLKKPIYHLRARCSYCHRVPECLARALQPLSISDTDNSLDNHSHVLHAGEHLFYAGEAFQSIYVVRSGSFKAYKNNENGHETVVALYLGTELIGLEAIDRGAYPYSAVALETSSYCPVTPEQMMQVCQTDTETHQEILQAISREIDKEQEHILTILAHKTAYEQTAAFIFNLSARYKRLGYSPREFRIPLSRWELASYLGLTVETISRTLSNLHRRGLIQLRGRLVTILDMQAIKEAAGNGECRMLSN